MPMLIDESHLPAMLTTGPMTDDQFLELCMEHEDLRFELTADGELIIHPVPHNLTAIREEELFVQLHAWAKNDGRGRACSSNQWFTLPSGARRVPDAAWVLKSRVAELPPEALNKYWPLCPDFVAEVRSHSDRLPVLRAKMEEWITNGAQLGWLIDPERRAVEVYRTGATAVIIESPVSVLADAPPMGGSAASIFFRLDLRPIWEPLAEL
jgi:Uma2 family endonuclease